MTNHMPAPWTLANVNAAERGPVQIKSRHRLTVGTAYTVDDAQLMAAAPEMLAALEAVLDTEMRPDMTRLIVEAAIAKAHGR